MDRLIRMMLGRFLNRGLRGGIDRVARRGRDPATMTPEKRHQARQAKQTAKRARQAMRAARRIGRF